MTPETLRKATEAAYETAMTVLEINSTPGEYRAINHDGIRCQQLRSEIERAILEFLRDRGVELL